MSYSLAAVSGKNAALNAVTANMNSGTVIIYDGTPPATADTALSSNNVLATLSYGATAFAAASAGVATANAIASVTATRTGTASFFRSFKSDTTTVVEQGGVGTSGQELNINSVSIISGAPVTVTSRTITAGN